jgi:uncharacterized protein YgiM (DUF1202 family)
VSTPQSNWNFGWPVAIAIVAVVGGVLVLAAMNKLPTEMFGVRWATPSPSQLSTPPSAAINGSVDQPSIQPTSTSLTQAESISSPIPSLTTERTGVVDDVDRFSNLRSSPSLEDDTNILIKVPNGTSVTILEELSTNSGRVWYKVQVGEQTGWMARNIIRVD